MENLKIDVRGLSAEQKEDVFEAIEKLVGYKVNYLDSYFYFIYYKQWSQSFSEGHFQDHQNKQTSYNELMEITGMSDKKTFTKADLKDGMKVTFRDGSVKFLLGVNLLSYDSTLWSGNGGYTQATYITNFMSDLKHTEFDKLDIVKVVDRDGTILFQRPPAKTQTEIELEKLQRQIAELTAQANKLQQTL